MYVVHSYLPTYFEKFLALLQLAAKSNQQPPKSKAMASSTFKMQL